MQDRERERERSCDQKCTVSTEYDDEDEDVRKTHSRSAFAPHNHQVDGKVGVQNRRRAHLDAGHLESRHSSGSRGRNRAAAKEHGKRGRSIIIVAAKIEVLPLREDRTYTVG